MMLNFEELPASSRQVECPKMDRELNHGSISSGDERGWTIGEGENPRHSRNQEIKSPCTPGGSLLPKRCRRRRRFPTPLRTSHLTLPRSQREHERPASSRKGRDNDVARR